MQQMQRFLASVIEQDARAERSAAPHTWQQQPQQRAQQASSYLPFWPRRTTSIATALAAAVPPEQAIVGAFKSEDGGQFSLTFKVRCSNEAGRRVPAQGHACWKPAWAAPFQIVGLVLFAVSETQQQCPARWAHPSASCSGSRFGADVAA